MKTYLAVILLTLASCGLLGGTPTQQEKARQEIAQGAKDVAPFLPPPFDYIAYGASALLLAYGGHKGARTLGKARAAKKAFKAQTP